MDNPIPKYRLPKKNNPRLNRFTLRRENVSIITRIYVKKYVALLILGKSINEKGNAIIIVAIILSKCIMQEAMKAKTNLRSCISLQISMNKTDGIK